MTPQEIDELRAHIEASLRKWKKELKRQQTEKKKKTEDRKKAVISL
ncbi:MAG TPA: hypothetical protein VEA18_03450 [Candidatus Kapabacteria bacterium]|nr:hypothetical protein [Candidatus Kapabacteria bacterium]